MLRSPRIGDIGNIPPLEKEEGGESADTRKPGGGTDGTGYFAQPMDGGGMAGADGGVDSAGQVMEREIWQETDTMYDNLPFDPAYRTSLPIPFCKSLTLLCQHSARKQQTSNTPCSPPCLPTLEPSRPQPSIQTQMTPHYSPSTMTGPNPRPSAGKYGARSRDSTRCRLRSLLAVAVRMGMVRWRERGRGKGRLPG
jgi:hypothetical protein